MTPPTHTSRHRAVLMSVVVAFATLGAVFVSDGRQLLPSSAPPVEESSTMVTGPSTDPAPAEVVTPADPPPPTTSVETVPAGQPAADPYAWLQDVGESGRTFLGVSTETDSDRELEAFSTAAGRVPDVVMVSRDWAGGGFDRATVERLTKGGRLPMIAWEPWDYTAVLPGDRLRSVQPAYTLRSIIDGYHDELIRAWATAAAEWGQPIALRFAHEMNGYWYPWAESANGNQEGDFVLAWRRVHDLFVEAGATNVIWVWSPNLSQSTLTPLAQVWPGDEYVDWVGLVGYLGNGIDPAQWTPTFGELFGPTIEEVRTLTDRPIVITEIGATEAGGKKAGWITEVLETVAADETIIGLMWFEMDKEADWRIVSSPEAQAAFARGVSDDALWGVPRNGRSTSELAADISGVS